MDRQKEELTHELAISVYDTERNEKAKKKKKELVGCVLFTSQWDFGPSGKLSRFFTQIFLSQLG